MSRLCSGDEADSGSKSQGAPRACASPRRAIACRAETAPGLTSGQAKPGGAQILLGPHTQPARTTGCGAGAGLSRGEQERGEPQATLGPGAQQQKPRPDTCSEPCTTQELRPRGLTVWEWAWWGTWSPSQQAPLHSPQPCGLGQSLFPTPSATLTYRPGAASLTPPGQVTLHLHAEPPGLGSDPGQLHWPQGRRLTYPGFVRAESGLSRPLQSPELLPEAELCIRLFQLPRACAWHQKAWCKGCSTPVSSESGPKPLRFSAPRSTAGTDSLSPP